MDLGASLAYWAEEGDGDLAKVFNISWLPEILREKKSFCGIQKRADASLVIHCFYYAFGLYKNAVIAQQIYARWKQGTFKRSKIWSTYSRNKGSRPARRNLHRKKFHLNNLHAITYNTQPTTKSEHRHEIYPHSTTSIKTRIHYRRRLRLRKRHSLPNWHKTGGLLELPISMIVSSRSPRKN